MALKQLPTALGIPELVKGYFPHLYNTPTNQGQILNHLPDIEYYDPESMKKKDREQFIQWYQQHCDDPFDLDQELIKYCKSDVDILRRACLAYIDYDSPKLSDPFMMCILCNHM